MIELLTVALVLDVGFAARGRLSVAEVEGAVDVEGAEVAVVAPRPVALRFAGRRVQLEKGRYLLLEDGRVCTLDGRAARDGRRGPGEDGPRAPGGADEGAGAGWCLTRDGATRAAPKTLAARYDAAFPEAAPLGAVLPSPTGLCAALDGSAGAELAGGAGAGVEAARGAVCLGGAGGGGEAADIDGGGGIEPEPRRARLRVNVELVRRP